jgi:hypothetical protein
MTGTDCLLCDLALHMSGQIMTVPLGIVSS